MKAIATLTSKGQITIPKVVRQLLGLQTGDALEFEERQGRVEIRSAKSRRTSAGVLKAHLPRDWKPPTVEGMDSAIGRHLRRQRTGG